MFLKKGADSSSLKRLCFFAFAALKFAHRSFVAFEIFALAAADITRFFLKTLGRGIHD